MQAVDDFLKTVLRSGLLDRDQLEAALRTVPAEQRDDPEAVAKCLVYAGQLSSFQARKLLEGTARGLLLGPYQVLAPIGRGGMSTVYLARDDRDQQLLALKVLPPGKARDKGRLLARFRREMELCQLVAHPHLARTYEVGVCNGVYYIAMEFIPGQSLHRLVGRQGPLEVPRAARLFIEVAAALDHAHDRGLIHRDLKPSNIMVTPNDHAKVLDLGLALLEGEEPTDREIIGGRGYVVGTMDYIAPEQTEDATRVGPRSDLYALGCTLYFALTGQPPYPGGTPQEKIQRHRNDQPVPVPQLNPGVPPGFIGVLRRLMARNPEQRFESAAELQKELLAWASQEPVLPLDQTGDSAYRQAIADLETEEPSTDIGTDAIEALADSDDQRDVIPVGILVSAPRFRGRPSPLALANEAKKPARMPHERWMAYLLGLEAAALVLIGAAIVILLYLLLR
jgi:serine/threonine protein kinase